MYETDHGRAARAAARAGGDDHAACSEETIGEATDRADVEREYTALLEAAARVEAGRSVVERAGRP